MSTDLGTVIGAILADITDARIRADLAAARAAQLYASDPLLKHMPVPRFRCPEVSLDLPLVVDEIEGGDSEAERSQSQRDPALTREVSDGILDDAMSYAGIKLNASQQKRLKTAAWDSLVRLSRAPVGLQGNGRIARELRRAVDHAFGEIAATLKEGDPARKRGRRLGSAVEIAVQEKLSQRLRRMSRLKVRHKTSEIKDLPDPSLVMHLRLTISEEAYEITLGEDDEGEPTEYFTPE